MKSSQDTLMDLRNLFNMYEVLNDETVVFKSEDYTQAKEFYNTLNAEHKMLRK